MGGGSYWLPLGAGSGEDTDDRCWLLHTNQAQMSCKPCFYLLTELEILSPSCSVFSAPAAAPDGLSDGAQPSDGLQPRESHPLPAVSVSETLERPAAGRAHLMPVQRRYSYYFEKSYFNFTQMSYLKKFNFSCLYL